MTAATLTLTDFLLARIAEDEAAATVIRDCEYFHGVESDAEAEVLRLSDPARVLAECEAKRRIVEEHLPDTERGSCGCCWLADMGTWETFPCPTMKAVALPYADHPDFRDEWRP